MKRPHVVTTGKRRGTRTRGLTLEPLEARWVLDGAVVFNEIHYHPAGAGDNLEWIELHNQMTINMDISGWRLAGGVNFDIPQGTVVPGRGYLVIAQNPAAFQAATGVAGALGPWTGSLDNDGEQLTLVNNSDRVVNELDYADDSPWPVGPDGSGATLAKRNRDLATAPPANWTTSVQLGGTPGAANFPEADLGPVTTTIVPTDAAWRYNDTGADLQTAWRDPAYNDAAWDTGPGPFFAGAAINPLDLTGLALWLDADASHVVKDASNRVSAWNDLIGATNNTAAQNVGQANLGQQPLWIASAIGNRPALRFDGVDDLLNNIVDNLLTSGTDRTIIVVGDGNDAGEGGSLVTLRRTGAVFNAQIAGPNTYVYTDGQVVNILAPNLLPTIRSPFASVHRVAGGTLTVDVNGATRASGAIARPENGATGFTIGNREDFPSQRWNGDIAEVLIYNRNLSAAELTQVNAYLNQKYGLTGSKTELALGPTTDYFRYPFQFSGDPALAQLRFLTALDDGAVFYLNGQEIYRQNMPPGAVAYGTLASNSVEQPQLGASIAVPDGILHAGTNALAVEVHQALVADPDMHFEMSMTVTVSPPAADAAPALAFNEIAAATDPQFFVELSNAGIQPIDLAAYQIVSSGVAAPVYPLPAQALASGALLAVTAAQLGFTPADGDRLFLVNPSQSLVADAAIVKDQLRGRSAQFDGRWLYPDVATPGAANLFALRDEVVINEIMYHHRPKAATPGTPATFETTTLIPINATWKYNRAGANLGSSWYTTNYVVDNVTWRSGPAVIGVEPSALPAPILTTWSPYVSSVRTYYFQQEFAFSSAPAGSVLQIRHLVDDGAVFYLNGAEIPGTRFMLAAGTVDGTTLASPGIDNAAYSNYIDIPLNLLNVGNNVISVEVHQNSVISSDTVFGLEMVLQRETIPAVPGDPFLDNPEEWIELLNRSAAPVDISGWQLDDAVQYTFPANTIIAPGQYLVVAADALALAAEYPTISISGSYSGTLSNSDERLLLRDDSGNPANEVHYFDGGYWPEAADGLGSSLELRDPAADNSRAEAWAASDESNRGAWQSVSYTGVAQASSVGPDGTWNEFILGLLDDGEMLLDDIHVVQNPNGTPIELLQNSTFENDSPGSGPATWRLIGTHGSHGQSQVVVDPDNPANHVLRLVATGPSEQLFNHAETTLKNGATFVSIQNGAEYRISFRAKPISGLAQVNTRLYFNRLAQTNVLTVPVEVGTPGAVNSRQVSNAGPTYQGLVHAPAVPQPGEEVIVSVAAGDPNGVANMTLWYSVAGGAWNSAAMTQSGGVYRGTIPGQAAGSVVQFYVAGVDGLGASSTFPDAGPQSRALLQFDDGMSYSGPLDDFRLIMKPADTTYLHQATNALSNDLLGATAIYRGQEVFYDVGVRLKGSERGRGQDVRYGYSLRFQADHLFRGVYDRAALDRSSPFDVSSRELLVKYAANSAGGIPGTFDDLIHLVAPRPQQTGDATLVLDRYGDDYLDTQFDGGSDGTLFELELVYYPTSTVDGNPESLKIPYPNPDSVIGISSVGDMGNDKERYRHTYLIHNNRDRDDYTRIIAMAKAFSLSGQAFLDAIPGVIDVDEFLRVYALENLFGIEDTYVTGGLLHNAAFFVRPEDGRAMLFPFDMDYAFAKSATGSLVQNNDLSKMIAAPGYAHAYYGHLHDLITKTFNSTYVNTWVTYFDSLLAESFASQGSFINARSSFVLAQLNTAVPNIAFNVTTPDSSVATSSLLVQGTGWVNVREIYIDGRSAPLNLTWTTTTAWQATVPLQFGTHPLTFRAYDFQGNPIGNDTITVTTTAGQPIQDALRVSELMYHPADASLAELAIDPTLTDDDFEYVEIKNIGVGTVDLTGVQILGGVTFNFSGSAVTSLAPGEYALVVESAAGFAARYNTAGLHLAGEYGGNLSNGGESLELRDSLGQTIQIFTYDDSGLGWHPTTDGDGPSLVIIDPLAATATWNDGASWRPSVFATGSPGADDVLPNSTIVGRQIFYNNSSWDGNDAAANPTDDAAIATDKSALLPGGAATLVNYTSFNKGINGIMIDVQNPAGTITAADFVFKTGNANNTTTWTVLATAPTVSIRPGAGTGGSTRITLTWLDGTIKKQWLQVRTLANANTGLAADDVFYFGNAIGESGNAANDAQVNAADELAARGNPRNIANPAPVTFLFDYNRDKQVNAADQLISRGNPTNLATRLLLITPTAGPGAAPLGAGLAEALLGAHGNAALDEAIDLFAPRVRKR